jgi:predicted nuclease of predicted toxin-antitoxin system
VAVKYLLDEHLPRALLAGLKRKAPHVDVVRVHELGASGFVDPEVLSLAAREGRIVVSKDKATLRDFAAQRVERGERMPGVLIIRPAYLRGLSGLGVIIRELIEIDELTDSKDWEGVIRFIPSPVRHPPA